MRISSSLSRLKDLTSFSQTFTTPDQRSKQLLRRDALAYGSCVDMLTQHNDAARTGAAACETQLNPASVAGGSFGKLYSRSVDGEIYAQPLYVSGASINGETKNVVVVATMNNSVYVFDADDTSTDAPLWSYNLGPAFPTSNYGSSYKDALGVMGVLGTPVIDKAKGLIYTVSAQLDASSETPTSKHVITALNLADGSVALGGPQTVTASVPGTSSDSVDGVLSFDSLQHIQRPGLLLSQGQLVVGFGSHGDYTPYHGWLMSYDATSLAQTGVYSTTTDSLGGSLWQSGQGIAVGPDGALYGVTSNGFGSNATEPSERVESLIKWTLNPGVQFVDSFTPSDYEALDASDLDFGSCGPIIPPNSDRVISGGKDGKLYSVPQSSLGGLVSGDPTAQEVAVSSNSLYGAPVYFNGPNGPQLFIQAPGDALKAFSFVNNMLSTTPVQTNGDYIAPAGVPGGILTVSTNGDDASSGIVWANLVASGNANQATQPGVLKAFSASDITQQLWSSDTNANDASGEFGKFVPPTVADGKVFLATFSNQLVVYGLAVNNSTNTTGTPAVSSMSSVAGSSALSSIASSTSASLGAASSAPSLPFSSVGNATSASVAPSTAMSSSGPLSSVRLNATTPSSSNSTSVPTLAPVTTSQTPDCNITSVTAVAPPVTVTVSEDCSSTPALGVVSTTSATTSTSSCASALTDVVNIPAGTTWAELTSASAVLSSATPVSATTSTLSTSSCITGLTDVVNIPVGTTSTTPTDSLSAATVASSTASTPTDILSFATADSSTASTPTDITSVASLTGSVFAQTTLPTASTPATSTPVDTQSIGNLVTTPSASNTAPVFVSAAAGHQMAPNLALAAVLIQAVRALM